MYTRYEQAVIVGSQKDITKEMTQRVADGWNIANTRKDGDNVILTVDRENPAPK